MTHSKLKFGATTILVLAAISIILWQQTRVNWLAAEKAALREQLQKATELAQANQRLTEQLKAEAEARQNDNRELMRLRAQASSLRQAQQENARLKEERERLIKQAKQPRPAQSEEAEPEPTPELKRAYARMNLSRRLGLALHMFADEHEDQFPTNWTAIAPYLATNPPPAEAIAYGVRDDQFELVYQGSLRDLKGTEDIILAREKEAIQSSDGRWARTYVFVDGHSEIHAETNDDFTAWEQQRHARAAQASKSE